MQIVVPTSTSAPGVWNLKTVGNSILNYSWPQPDVEVRYLIVAGGGGGGSDMGGGGGGGGVLTNVTAAYGGQTSFTKLLSPGRYPIIVGQGGAGAPAGTGQPRGSNGGNSSALGLIAIGGGGGASSHDNPNSPAGSGGSGGGGSGARGGTYIDLSTDVSSTRGGAHGLGTPGQGNDGCPSGRQWYPGGGGGAASAGGYFEYNITTGNGYQPGAGGRGVTNGILWETPSSWGGDWPGFLSYPYYGGGGGGAGYTFRGGDGGWGGGGAGAVGGSLGETSLAQPKAPQPGNSPFGPGSRGGNGETNSWANQPGGNGAANTGGGGGGGSHYNLNNYGGNGGSGVVIIRYNGIQKFTGGTIVQWCDRSQSGNNSLLMQNRSLLRTAHIFYESGELVG